MESCVPPSSESPSTNPNTPQLLLSVVHSVLQGPELTLHLGRQVGSHLLAEVGPQLTGLLLPEGLGDVQQGTHVHAAAQALGVDGAVYGQPADGAAPGRLVLCLPAAAPEDPLQHAGVLAETGPQEGAAGRVLPEPVDVEDPGQLGRAGAALHAQPVGQVVAKVVAKEGPHGEGVVHQNLPCRSTEQLAHKIKTCDDCVHLHHHHHLVEAEDHQKEH